MLARLLTATEMLLREVVKAVSQTAIARFTGVDRMTASTVIRRLTERGLLERAPESGGPAYRVLITPHGSEALRAASSVVRRASQNSFAGVPSLASLRSNLLNAGTRQP